MKKTTQIVNILIFFLIIASIITTFIKVSSIHHQRKSQNLIPIEGAGQYYTDGENIYYREEIMKYTDLKSFTDLSINAYSKDKNYVYRFSTIVEGANPETFQPLYGNYAKDNQNVYFASTLIEEADNKTFEVLKCIWRNKLNNSNHFARDVNHAYYMGEIIKDIDPKNFFFEDTDCTDIKY